MFIPNFNEEKKDVTISVAKGNLWKQSENNKPQKKSFVVSISGSDKTGKTTLLASVIEVGKIEIFGRVFGDVKELYVIDFEGDFELEVLHHFKKYADEKKIHIVDPRVYEDELKRKPDFAKSYEKFSNLIDELFGLTNIAVCIDGFKFVEDCLYFLLVEDVKQVGFDEFGIPNKDVTPTDQVWKKKKVWDVLYKLKNLNVPVFISNKIKPETKSTSTFFAYTGAMVEDIVQGVQYYYDVKVRIEKVLDPIKNVMVRKAFIKDTRFEEEDVSIQGIVVEKPTARKIIDAIIENCKMKI
jgi:hypothetical protein